MKLTVLTEEQKGKLQEMYFLLPRKSYTYDMDFLHANWLELCFFYLITEVAELHGKQPYSTPSWSTHMVKQRVVDNMPTVNPIDTLYDIWLHPEKYSQSL